MSLFSNNTVSAGEKTGFWNSIYNFFFPHKPNLKIIFAEQTQYYNINVEQDQSGKRFLVFLPKNGYQGIWDQNHPLKLYSNYLRSMMLALAVKKESPKQILFIGLGGGILPMFLRHYYPDLQIDIVEIDPKMTGIAETYFGFKKDPNMAVIIDDGRAYINKCKKNYDIVFIDAYNAETIPFQLTTVEFFTKAKGCLTDHGVITCNLASTAGKKFLASELKTVEQVFKNILVYSTPDQTNLIPIASKSGNLSSEKALKHAIELDQKHKFTFSLETCSGSRMTKGEISDYIKKGILLTDNYAPVNYMGK